MRSAGCPRPKRWRECRLTCATTQFAETIGLVGTLDSHPKISRVPTIAKTPALFQQAAGTRDNPFTHVIPSGLSVDHRSFSELFSSPKAQDFIARTFGMGVLAPRDWSDQEGFETPPVNLNIVDNISEAYRREGGLVGAFVTTLQMAANSGKWTGSGIRQHNASSLAEYIHEHYQKVWRPNASEAYYETLGHLTSQLKEAVGLATPTASKNQKGASRCLTRRSARLRVRQFGFERRPVE